MRKKRTQAKQSFVRNTAVGYSKKHGVACILESRLEIDYMRRKAFDLTSEQSFKMQPSPYVHMCNGRQVNYTPDGTEIDGDHVYIDEVKHFKDTQTVDFKNKCNFLTDQYIKEGKIFRVYTEKELRPGYKADNIAQIYPSLNHPVPYIEFCNLTEDLPYNSCSIKEMNEIADTKNIDRVFVKRAIAHKLFQCDLHVKWSQLVLTWGV